MASLEPGATHWFTLRAERAEDGDAGSLVAVVRGTRPGPVGYFGAGTHGDELNSIEAVRRVAVSLDPQTVTGTVILAVAHNVNAFNTHTRLNPLDGKNPDHCFPGDAAGSPTEVLAHTLFSTLVSQADYVLDLHCASRGGWNPLYAIAYGETPGVAGKSVELAAQFGVQVVLDVQREPDRPLGSAIGSALDHNLFVRSALQGRPSALIEFGSSAVLTSEQIDLGVAGVLNVLRSRGQMSDRPARVGEPLVTQGATTLHSPAPGFLTLRKTSGQPITRGEKVGFLRPLVGDTVPLTAPIDGVILRVAAEATVAAGDRVITVASSEN